MTAWGGGPGDHPDGDHPDGGQPASGGTARFRSVGTDDLVAGRAPRFLVGATVDGSRMHRAGLEELSGGGVVARPPHEVRRRPVASERPCQKGEGGVAAGDRQGRARSGDRLEVDERACRRGHGCRRVGERWPKARREPEVADERESHLGTVDLREQKAGGT